ARLDERREHPVGRGDDRGVEVVAGERQLREDDQVGPGAAHRVDVGLDIAGKASGRAWERTERLRDGNGQRGSRSRARRRRRRRLVVLPAQRRGPCCWARRSRISVRSATSSAGASGSGSTPRARRSASLFIGTTITKYTAS